MKTKHGEHIELYWEWDPNYECVRGHVSAAEAAAAIKANGLDPAHYRDPDHEYARWSQDASAKPDGCDAVLVLYKERGRGRFPVTVYRPLAAKPPPSGGAT